MNDDPVERGREIGGRIRERRQRRGLSQLAVARIADITQGSLSNYERGKRDIPLPTFLGILAALDVGVRELLDVAQDACLRRTALEGRMAGAYHDGRRGRRPPRTGSTSRRRACSRWSPARRPGLGSARTARDAGACRRRSIGGPFGRDAATRPNADASRAHRSRCRGCRGVLAAAREDGGRRRDVAQHASGPGTARPVGPMIAPVTGRHGFKVGSRSPATRRAQWIADESGRSGPPQVRFGQ